MTRRDLRNRYPDFRRVRLPAPRPIPRLSRWQRLLRWLRIR